MMSIMFFRVVWLLLLVLPCGLATGCASESGGDDSSAELRQGADFGPTTDGGLHGIDAGEEVGNSCPPHVTAPKLHRSEASACDSDRPDGPQDFAGAPAAGFECISGSSSCVTDSDCTESENGRCVGNDTTGHVCTYDECFGDADCGPGFVCECEGGWESDQNVCVAAACLTDADCGEEGWCSPSRDYCGVGAIVGYFCRTCADECVDDSDCGGTGPFDEPFCGFDQNLGFWRCLEFAECPCD